MSQAYDLNIRQSEAKANQRVPEKHPSNFDCHILSASYRVASNHYVDSS